MEAAVVFEHAFVDEGEREELPAVGVSSQEKVRPGRFHVGRAHGTVVQDDGSQGVRNAHPGHHALDGLMPEGGVHVVPGLPVRDHIVQPDDLQAGTFHGFVLQDVHTGLAAKVLDIRGIHIGVVVAIDKEHGSREALHRADDLFRAIVPTLDEIAREENHLRMRGVHHPHQFLQVLPAAEMPQMDISELYGRHLLFQVRQFDRYLLQPGRSRMDEAVGR